MKNLDKIIDKIENTIDEKNSVREKALKYSRDVIVECRKGIQLLHQELINEAEEAATSASKKLEELCSFTKDHSDIYHAGFVENAAQEVAEARCFLNIMKGEELPDPDELHIAYSAYLLGLCDLIGELRRRALDLVRVGESAKADEYLKYMENIYQAIMRFDYPSALVPIRKKQDMARNLIEKTRGELVIASCERRIEHKTDEFKELLDRVTGSKKQRKEKTQNERDLDIDQVW